jgi:hypothetical protein
MKRSILPLSRVSRLKPGRDSLDKDTPICLSSAALRGLGTALGGEGETALGSLTLCFDPRYGRMTEARRALHDDGWSDSFDKLEVLLRSS